MEYSVDPDPCSCLVSLEMVPSGRNREAKPSTAHPLSTFPRTLRLCHRHHSILPLPTTLSLSLSLRFHPFPPPCRDIISPGRAYLLADARSPTSLSSWNELQIRYSYEHNGALLGKYDSVISYSLCRNRLRRTICG